MSILERHDTGAVAHLHMNAPDRLNALSDEMLAVFEEHYPQMMLDAEDWEADVAREVEAS